MKLRLKDVISHQGRDFLVEGILTYKIAGKTYPLARVVDGQEVRWVEPLLDDLDDRILIFSEITNLPVGTPPPPTISYQGKSFVPRFSGATTMTTTGNVGGRPPGACEVWRYRAAGDVFLQIEKWPDRVIVRLAESVHKDMVSVLPAP